MKKVEKLLKKIDYRFVLAFIAALLLFLAVNM